MAERFNGFTLLEVLVALTILGLALTVLLQGFSTSMDRIDRAEADAAAISTLTSLRDQLGDSLPLQEGTQEGNASDGSHWSINITPYMASNSPADWEANVWDVQIACVDAAGHTIGIRALIVGRRGAEP